MRGITLAGAAAALAVGVNALPQVANAVAPDANVKTTATTTLTKTVVQTNKIVSTVTNTITATAKAVTTVTSVHTLTQTIQGCSIATVTATATQPASTVTITVGGGTTTTPSPTTMTTTELARQVNPTETAGASASGLADYAAAIGKYFGTAVDYPGTGEGSDPIYLAVAKNTHDFQQYTPANIMKYVYTEPAQGQFNFTQADQFVQFATQDYKRQIRCHNLVWYSQLPSWLTQGTWTNETLIAVMENHIEALITHFGNNCSQWDVVNEALSDSGTAAAPWRTSDIWYQYIGPSYVSIAFAKAQAVVESLGLSTKLFYNDYNLEWPGQKTTNAYTLVQNLTAAGIRIDGVGQQAHLIIGESPSAATFLGVQQGFTNLTNSEGKGIEVALTELDIRAQTMPPTDQMQIQQFYDYGNVTLGCAMNPACVGITLWDFDDTYSWVPGTFAGQGYACPWFLPPGGKALVRKIAYDGIIDGLTNTRAL